ncbi:MAG: hypothetical protein ABIT08_16280 [Bacteroidia bacterium]
MRNYKLHLLLVCSLYCTSSAYAQSIFSIKEVTEGGTGYDVKIKTDTCKNGSVKTKYPNIDINSSLEIKLNKDSIKVRAGSFAGNNKSIPQEQMYIISQVLVKRADLIEKINIDSKARFEDRVKALGKVAANMQPVYDFILALPPETPLQIKAIEAFSIPGNESYIAFFNVLQDEIDRIKIEYKDAVEANKIYFRLGAFINETPVHLDGFDIYKEGEFYRVPRFATTIGQDEKDKFDKYKEIAEKANTDAGKVLNQMVKDALTQYANSLKEMVKARLSEPFLKFKIGIDTITNASADLKLKIQKAQADISQLESDIQHLIADAKNTDDPDYISKLKTGIYNLIQKVTTVKSSVEKTISEIKTSFSPSAWSAYNDFENAFNSGKDTLISIITQTKNFFETQIQSNLDITQNINESLLKLDNEVKKLPLENIPDETRLNLLTSAHRKEGDKLYLKAVVGKQPPGTETADEKTIDYIPIGLYQIALHSTINAVLLFVDNLSAEYPAKTQFQLDPSYSVLFKLGSRKHTAYNNFFEIGAGLNMATLDFNNDNTPEIGVGVVVSTFKDYLQVGVGRNMTIDQYYWFLGIRLPFLGVDLTGAAKNGGADK